MSNTKFTKCDWVAVEHLYNHSYAVINSHSGEQIAYLNQGEANAHLIAAAPEMYEILESIYNAACYTGTYSSEMDQIKALLAKARGES